MATTGCKLHSYPNSERWRQDFGSDRLDADGLLDNTNHDDEVCLVVVPAGFFLSFVSVVTAAAFVVIIVVVVLH